jgi:hypothetical protein
VVLGSHDLTKAKEPHRLEIKTQKAFPHPKYDAKTVSNDIALLKLPKKIKFNSELNSFLLFTYLQVKKLSSPTKLGTLLVVCLNKTSFM